MLPRFLGRSLQCSAAQRVHPSPAASSSSAAPHDIETDTSKSRERFGKHEASEVAFSPTRLEDITHNYTRASDDARPPAEHVAENTDAYSCGSNVNLYAHMQSNVPEPFTADNASPESPTSLNMPGGGAQSTSYMYLSEKRNSAK